MNLESDKTGETKGGIPLAMPLYFRIDCLRLGRSNGDRVVLLGQFRLMCACLCEGVCYVHTATSRRLRHPSSPPSDPG